MSNSGEALSDAAAQLRGTVSGKVTTGEPVSSWVSFRVGGPAAILIEPEGPQDLARVGEVLARHRLQPLVIGRGTNLLVSDRGFAGVVVRLSKGFDWIRSEDETVEAGGATSLPQVANRAARLGLTGMEFCAAIPAAVGGAVRMNAGAHGTEISDILESVMVCDLVTGSIATKLPADLDMGYRQSALSGSQVVCSARFALKRGDPASIAAKMNEYRSHRSETQPSDAPNAGSMFRNPTDDAAGRLIEEAGLKGHRVGDAEVSSKHANFFLAHPGTTAQQIYDLMAFVQARVLEKFGVLLMPEVRVVGEFDTAARLQGVQ